MAAAGLERTRRELFLGVRRAFAQAEGDAALLEAAVELEQRMALAYDAVAGSPEVDPATARLARVLLRHERQHADGLAGALRDLGGRPPAGPESPADVPGLAQALSGGTDELLRFAVELEGLAVAAYHDALGGLRRPELLRAAASIMASEGQHLVVLRQALGRNPVPSAFETGDRGVA